MWLKMRCYKQRKPGSFRTENCRFLSEWGDSFNLGVDSVDPESNKCPPDTCIEIFESPIQKKDQETAQAISWSLVRVGRFELPAS